MKPVITDRCEKLKHVVSACSDFINNVCTRLTSITLQKLFSPPIFWKKAMYLYKELVAGPTKKTIQFQHNRSHCRQIGRSYNLIPCVNIDKNVLLLLVILLVLITCYFYSLTYKGRGAEWRSGDHKNWESFSRAKTQRCSWGIKQCLQVRFLFVELSEKGKNQAELSKSHFIK